ncbi:MAG TPA: DUF6666 family protein [Gemmataceae bacterium]|nr:DUF6666 family protein [Gemmataceae bacterium]
MFIARWVKDVPGQLIARGSWVLFAAVVFVGVHPGGVSAEEAGELRQPDDGGTKPQGETDRAASWRLLTGTDVAEELSAAPPESAAPGDAAKAGADTGWADNLSLFLGLTGSKGPEDLGINANFGFRTAVNWGLPVWEEYGLGVQFGSSLNYSRTAVRVLSMISDTHDRIENFSTAGVFQRSNLGVNWGVVYDFVDERYYSSFTLGQWRGQVGYDVTANDEVGLWGAWREHGANASVDDETFSLRPILQGNIFWRHVWRNEITTRAWVGVAEEHGRFIFVAPGEPPVHHPVVFGADVFVPLTDYLSIFGEANFITPNDSGTVTATFGIAFYPGGGATRAARSRFAPLLPLANNPTFATDLRQP